MTQIREVDIKISGITQWQDQFTGATADLLWQTAGLLSKAGFSPFRFGVEAELTDHLVIDVESGIVSPKPRPKVTVRQSLTLFADIQLTAEQELEIAQVLAQLVKLVEPKARNIKVEVVVGLDTGGPSNSYFI